MRFALFIIAGLAGLATASSKAANVFKKAERAVPVIERNDGHGFQNPRLQKRASRYLTNATEKFLVNGTGVPEVRFDIAPTRLASSSSGSFPSSNPAAKEEIALWFNGGPGCSSLTGLLAENGPFLWQAGTASPTRNPYSWTNLTNMVWVEQPVGVGFTQGTPNITDEVELAQEFIGFYKQFAKTFGLEDYKVYLTGESYAGYYVPYIADAFINANDTTYYNLQGISINDPIIGDERTQQDVVIVDYLDYWQNLFFLNDTFLAEMHQRNEKCGYTQYVENYLTYPPPGPLPDLPDPYTTGDGACAQWATAYYALMEVNPCFNIYHVTDTCPWPWSVLAGVNTGDYVFPDESVYFNRSDIQAAIHAPVGTNWAQCADINVFGGASDNTSIGDTSLGPAQDGVLQHVIESTNNVIIGSGNLDMILSTNGTLLAIQNMTWNGLQGLQSYPNKTLYVPYHAEYNGAALASAGELGLWGSERGLTFYQVQLSGHELPEYAPGAAYRMLEILLGRVSNFSDTSDFTTQTGNFSGAGSLYRRYEAHF